MTRKTIIIGLGNPILGDDGVGWVVAEQLAAANRDPSIAIECLATGGLDLAERLSGYDRAIVVDAIVTGEQPIGTVRWFALDELPDRSAGHTVSAHDASLATAMRACRQAGLAMPDEVWVVAVEARDVRDFSESISPAIAAAIPRLTAAVEAILAS